MDRTSSRDNLVARDKEWGKNRPCVDVGEETLCQRRAGSGSVFGWVDSPQFYTEEITLPFRSLVDSAVTVPIGTAWGK